ncbi:MAG: hypothetical protein LJE68_05000 [Rhodobacter sp.]|nr:hypothetical protein [Rhodobacter sp.]
MSEITSQGKRAAANPAVIGRRLFAQDIVLNLFSIEGFAPQDHPMRVFLMVGLPKPHLSGWETRQPGHSGGR